MAKRLPPDLLKRLGDGVVAFTAGREDQAASRPRFRAAAESIRQSLDAAGKTIDVLMAIAAGTADAPPAVLTKLRMAKRVGPRVSPPAAKPPAASGPADKAA